MFLAIKSCFLTTVSGKFEMTLVRRMMHCAPFLVLLSLIAVLVSCDGLAVLVCWLQEAKRRQ